MSWPASLLKMLWLNRRFGHRKVDYAAPVISVDDALAAYCERYVVCDDDVATVRDDDGNDSGGSAYQDSSPSTGAAGMISHITLPSPAAASPALVYPEPILPAGRLLWR